jgi:hypothetical protein
MTAWVCQQPLHPCPICDGEDLAARTEPGGRVHIACRRCGFAGPPADALVGACIAWDQTPSKENT